jgi:hypothetical protein
MSRFAMDPRWLVYLLPTMSPVATSLPDLPEHPAEAFFTYRADGVARVVCEDKHMGSRCVVVACRDETVPARRFFGASGLGAVYTRTGRPFFAQELSTQLLGRISAAVSAAGLWDEPSTDWLALDCELMPWSAKALDLLRTHTPPSAPPPAAPCPLRWRRCRRLYPAASTWARCWPRRRRARPTLRRSSTPTAATAGRPSPPRRSS